jgi:hypothetical protein
VERKREGWTIDEEKEMKRRREGWTIDGENEGGMSHRGREGGRDAHTHTGCLYNGEGRGAE